MPNTLRFTPLPPSPSASRRTQIYDNPSLTRTATVVLGRGARGVHRRRPGSRRQLWRSCVCRRELESDFVPQAYFEVVATIASRRSNSRCGTWRRRSRNCPAGRSPRRSSKRPGISKARWACVLKTSGKGRQSSTICLRCVNCAARSFGWPASKTLEVAAGDSMTARARRSSPIPAPEVRYLPESLISDVHEDRRRPAGGKVVQRAIPLLRSPDHQEGLQQGSFMTKDLRARAITPSFRKRQQGRRPAWKSGRVFQIDEKKLFDVIARAYLVAVMPDFRYRIQTTANARTSRISIYRADCRQPIELGWRKAAFPEWQPRR